eukprot:9863172-Prorocentrum_lima.AAC.1
MPSTSRKAGESLACQACAKRCASVLCTVGSKKRCFDGHVCTWWTICGRCLGPYRFRAKT